MISFSPAIKALIPRFKRHRNDIDIYTEDNPSDNEFYKELFLRLLDGKKVNDIQQLGSKNDVIEAYGKYLKNKKHIKQKQIYIVDGDIELIYNGNKKSRKGFFVLDSYCIENFLIDEEASIDIIHSKNPKDKNDIRVDFNFNNWLDNIKDELIGIFLNLSISHKIKKGHSMGSFSKVIDHALLDIVDKNKSLNFKNDIIRYNNTITKNYIKEIKNLESIWGYSKNTLLRIVSGKDYLLPILGLRISKISHRPKIENNELKMLLVKKCDLSRLDTLKKAILSL